MGEQPSAWAPYIRTGESVDQAEVGELRQALVDLREERAAGHRHDALVGLAPAQLLGDLVAQRAAALGVVGPHVDVDEGPVAGVGQLRAEAVDVVVGAVDRDDRGVVDGGAQHLAGLQVVRDEDDGAHAAAGRVCGDGVGQVAGRGAGQRLEAELAGATAGHGHDAVLEGPGGVHRVVLDPQFAHAEFAGQVVGPQQRREAHLQVDAVLGFDRQQRLVAPDGARPGRDRLAGDDAAHGVVVVGDLHGAEAVVAGVDRFERAGVTAFAAHQGRGVGHDEASVLTGTGSPVRVCRAVRAAWRRGARITVADRTGGEGGRRRPAGGQDIYVGSS